MASKALVFAAVALAVIAYATADECYVCSTLVTPDCAKPQGEGSNSFDCASQKALTGLDYVCGQFVYDDAVGNEVAQRTCIAKTLSCGDLGKELGQYGFVMKACKLCSEDKCNGQ